MYTVVCIVTNDGRKDRRSAAFILVMSEVRRTEGLTSQLKGEDARTEGPQQLFLFTATPYSITGTGNKYHQKQKRRKPKVYAFRSFCGYLYLFSVDRVHTTYSNQVEQKKRNDETEGFIFLVSSVPAW